MNHTLDALFKYVEGVPTCTVLIIIMKLNVAYLCKIIQYKEPT